MKTYRKELWFNVPARRAFINITSDLEGCINANLILVHGSRFFMVNLMAEEKNVFWLK